MESTSSYTLYDEADSNTMKGCIEAYGNSQARGRIGDAAARVHHIHSNTGSKPHLQPIPQLTAMMDPLIH